MLVEAADIGLKDEYRREMQGIARAGNVAYSDVLMANLYYEISGVSGILETPLVMNGSQSVFNQSSPRSCTSIVAQCSNGTVLLARNQDYPPPFSLIQTHAVFTRGGKKIYEGTMFAGTIGLATALRHNAPMGSWAVSINARSNRLNGVQQVAKAARAGAASFLNMVRDAMEDTRSYEAGIQHISTQALMLPGYFIVGGSAPGEGAIVTRNASQGNATDSDVYTLFSEGGKPSLAGGTWFVAQTNSDRWETQKEAPDFPFISRRGTAVRKLESIGAKSLDLLMLWDVLSTFPVYNFATIHTELVAPLLGEYRTYKRHGPL